MSIAVVFYAWCHLFLSNWHAYKYVYEVLMLYYLFSFIQIQDQIKYTV